MAERVGLTIDLGSNAPIEAVRKVIDDLDNVCQFGGELQYRSALNNAERAVLRRPSAWLDPRDDEFVYPWRGGYGVPSPALDAAAWRYAQEFGPDGPFTDTITTVERITYNNPIEIILGAGAVTILLLQMVRNWPERRRLNRALVADVEDEVATRKELRAHLVRGIREGDIQLTAQQIDDLLTKDIAESFRALGDARIDLRQLGPGEDGSGGASTGS